MRNKAALSTLIGLLIVLGNSANAWQPETSSPDEKVQKGIQAMMLTSKAFRVATEKTKPWLVSIESFGGVSAVQGRIGGIRGQGEGNTTGIMISDDGYILTSTFNFVQEPPIITVITGDGKRRVAKLLGRDNTRKICLLKIDNVEGMPTPDIVAPEDLEVGQWAISIGMGYGDTNPAISMGIVSATDRIAGKAVQTDANISPANYGGPLVDIEGRLIGICAPMNPTSQAVGAGVEWYDSGIGFAVPIHGLEDLVERLKKGETISPAFLGVMTGPNPGGKGLVVTQVVEDSAAAKAGIEENDSLILLNGTKIRDLMDLQQRLGRFESGDEIELTYLSKSEKKVKKETIELGAPPKPKTEKPGLQRVPEIKKPTLQPGG
jgi:serine protease Do